jgi:FkbM family methyltransferase
MRLMKAADRALRRLATRPDPLPIDVSGVRFEVTTSDLNDFRVMYARSVEEGVTDWLVRMAGTKPVVIWDVGANVGGVALNVTARCPNAQAVAIEASPRMAARLQRNVARNRSIADRITVLPIALTETSGDIAFYESAEPSNSGVGRLAEAENTEAQPCLVAGWAGDELIAQRLAAAPDMIKIDVEGFELPALRGLRDQLPDGRPLTGVRIAAEGEQIVVHDGSAAWHPESGQAIFDFQNGRMGSIPAEVTH